jgi:integrase/recombinase XerD
MEVVMLERFFLKPQTVERIMGCWLGQNIELYAAALCERGYSARSILRRIPILVQFAGFTDARQIQDLAQAEDVIEPFVDHWLSSHCVGAPTTLQQRERSLARCTVRHFYSLIVWKSDYQKRKAPMADPFVAEAPGFFAYLREERGLRPETLYQYRHHLRRFATYLDQAGCSDLRQLSLPIVSGFITTTAQEVNYSVMVGLASSLRVFLRYLRREAMLDRDISKLVEIPQRYRLADIPRSVSWEAVQKVLDRPDRRTVVGRRDFAMLLLMATYGLRAREIAALTLDDIDWKRDRLHVRERKADHTTAYPLAAAIGGAIIDYLKNGRPDVSSRVLFWRHLAPRIPLTHQAVACTATKYLREAGITVRRPGSHTLRHACVQRLMDSGFPLKTIGDYVGHRSASSTMIYAKVQVDALREVAMSDGEDLR